MRRRGWTLAAVVTAALFGVQAMAQEPTPAGTEPAGTEATTPAATLDGATLFMQRTCFACHGKDAKTPILPEYPKLAGQNEAYMVRQITDIKSGARNNGNTAAMQGILHLVNEEEIKALAAYLASLK
jgi:cytochrome c